jgi:hypothetical protein
MAHDFLPRTHTVSVSPDGKYTAFVRQHFNSDPPDDHLYLGPADGRARRLMDLAPDSDWCTTIVWTRDSRRVGFLIRDQRLAIFDAASGAHVATVVLVVPDGYPGSQEARDVAFSDDGTRITFERFDRPFTLLHRRTENIEAPLTSISPKRVEARPARSRGRETVSITPAPVR